MDIKENLNKVKDTATAYASAAVFVGQLSLIAVASVPVVIGTKVNDAITKRIFG